MGLKSHTPGEGRDVQLERIGVNRSSQTKPLKLIIDFCNNLRDFMPAIKKAKSNISYGGCAIVSSDVKNYANDPVIVKKNEEARIAVSKLTLPATEKK